MVFSLIKTPVASDRSLTSITSLEAPSSRTVTLGLRVSTEAFWRDTNIQSPRVSLVQLSPHGGNEHLQKPLWLPKIR